MLLYPNNSYVGLQEIVVLLTAAPVTYTASITYLGDLGACLPGKVIPKILN